MIQWLIKILIFLMGTVYVFLDRFLTHDTAVILDVPIDKDLQKMTREELCYHIEKKFHWEEGEFWNLESTQKIRVCTQLARIIMREEK